MARNENAEAKDWHRAELVAALHMRGWSLRQLSLSANLSEGAFARATRMPYPRAERAIADALGLHPRDIWPTRYDAAGLPNRPRGRKPLRGFAQAQSVAPPRGARNVSGKSRG